MLIQLRGVGKSYERGGEKLKILNELDLDVPKGGFEALMGPSGSGKTTLLNLIAGLDRPSSGTITVAGKRIDTMSEGSSRRGARTPSASCSRATTSCPSSPRWRT